MLKLLLEIAFRTVCGVAIAILSTGAVLSLFLVLPVSFLYGPKNPGTFAPVFTLLAVFYFLVFISLFPLGFYLETKVGGRLWDRVQVSNMKTKENGPRSRLQ